MLKLCPAFMKFAFISSKFCFLFCIVVVNLVLGLPVGRFSTNGHQNGPLESPKVKPVETFGIVYSPNDGDSSNRIMAKASENKNFVHRKPSKVFSRKRSKKNDESDEEDSKNEQRDSQDANENDEDFGQISEKVKPRLAQARLENLFRKHQKRRKKKLLQQNGHNRHGWKNYYYKEERGEKNDDQKATNGKDWKKRFKSFRPNNDGTLAADFSGQKTTLFMHKKGKRTRTSKKGNKWTTDDISNYDEGKGLQLSSQRAKISVGGKDSKRSKTKFGSIIALNRGRESDFDDDEAESDETLKDEAESDDEDAESAKVERKIANTKRPKLARKPKPKPKPKPKDTKVAPSIPATWLMSKNILQARSNVIKAFLRGEI